jgi:hypothetical protein
MLAKGFSLNPHRSGSGDDNKALREALPATMNTNLLLAAMLSGATLLPVQAATLTYNLQFTGSAASVGSGSLTIDDTPDEIIGIGSYFDFTASGAPERDHRLTASGKMGDSFWLPHPVGKAPSRSEPLKLTSLSL